MGLLYANTDEQVFDSLLEIRGEAVTFRDAPVRALINRTRPAYNPPGSIEISTLMGPTVQLPLSVTQPEIGEFVTDRFNIKHGFTKVTHYGHCWNCECEAS